MMHQQILDQLEQFEAGQLSDEGLEQWLLGHLQQILKSGDRRAIALSNELDALFIEESEGLLSHADVLGAICSLYAREKATIWIDKGRQEVQSSSDATVHKSMPAPEFPHTMTGLRGVRLPC